MAIKTTVERIKTMNKKLKKKIYFEIMDLKDQKGKGTGTKVVFKIPSEAGLDWPPIVRTHLATVEQM